MKNVNVIAEWIPNNPTEGIEYLQAEYGITVCAIPEMEPNNWSFLANDADLPAIKTELENLGNLLVIGGWYFEDGEPYESVGPWQVNMTRYNNALIAPNPDATPVNRWLGQAQRILTP